MTSHHLGGDDFTHSPMWKKPIIFTKISINIFLVVHSCIKEALRYQLQVVGPLYSHNNQAANLDSSPVAVYDKGILLEPCDNWTLGFLKKKIERKKILHILGFSFKKKS